MRRTNIYLDEGQLALLRGLGQRTNRSMADLVRTAVDEYLRVDGVSAVSPDEWGERFDRLLARRAAVGPGPEVSHSEIERDVADAIREVRRRPPRRR